ncbi:hypothetical protein HELRODRAFT_178771 [Helobdella robusta]|uniref:BACK domain-containing protein n=1 Tax=Helobdella robusta TaxID=6412 RepID=T1FDQ0_HELRO|nr:hypothetical protein HELRODRAFT_178771 [Helobdella robusta]ESN96967.1 hypothetical protein HELRODRAFT_178771 [Helobdella robusta]
MEKDHAEDDLRTIVLISKSGGRNVVPRASFLQTSDYYQALVNSGMKDAHLNELPLGYLSNVCLKEVRDFVSKFQCNKEKIKIKLPKRKQLKNVEEGLKGASYLQIMGMTSSYIEYLLKHLNDSSYTRLFDFSQTYALVEVIEKIYDFALKNFKKIAKCPEIMPFDVLHHLVKSEIVNADGEFDIFKLIIDWIFAEDSRRPCAEMLLKEIRFNLMSTTEKQKSADLLNKMELNVSLTGKSANRYHTSGTLFAFVLDPENLGQRYMEGYSLSLFDFVKSCGNRNSTTPPDVRFKLTDERGPPVDYEDCQLCFLNNVLYMIGEKYEKWQYKKTFAYDLTSSKWSRLSDMMVGRNDFYFGNVNGQLYVVAGSLSSGAVEKYIPEENRWYMLARLPVPVSNLAGCVYNGKLYVSGGIHTFTDKREKRMWQYDPASDSWNEQPSMLKKRYGHVLASVGNALFAVGGANERASTKGEMYDFATGQWSIVMKLKLPVIHSPSFLFSNCLYTVAQHYTESGTDEIYLQRINLSKYLNDKSSLSTSSSSNASHALPRQDIRADDYATNNRRKNLTSDNFNDRVDGFEDMDDVFDTTSDEEKKDGDVINYFHYKFDDNVDKNDDKANIDEETDDVVVDAAEDEDDVIFENDDDDYILATFDFTNAFINDDDDGDCQIFKCKTGSVCSNVAYIGIVNTSTDV